MDVWWYIHVYICMMNGHAQFSIKSAASSRSCSRSLLKTVNNRHIDFPSITFHFIYNILFQSFHAAFHPVCLRKSNHFFLHSPGWFFVFPCCSVASCCCCGRFCFIPVVSSSAWYHARYTCNHWASSSSPLLSSFDVTVQPKIVHFFFHSVHFYQSNGELLGCSQHEWRERRKTSSRSNDTDTTITFVYNCCIHRK